MKLAQQTIEILDNFERFYRLRQREWSALHEALEFDQNKMFDPVSVAFSYRIEQAYAYSELQYYKTCDLYDALQDIFDNDDITKHEMFASYLLTNRGLPGSQLIEKPDLSDDLIKWLFRYKKILQQYDFSFSDFEEAYKETCWKMFVDDVMQVN